MPESAALALADEQLFLPLPIVVTERAARPGLMETLRSRVPDPEIFEEHPPVFYEFRASDDTLDYYATRMMASTLRNYAADAARGVPFLDSHKTGTVQELLGRTLGGTFKRGGDGVPASTVITVYSQPTMHPAQRVYHDLIRSGQTTDCSVGFKDGRMVCSICGGEMFRWYRDADGDAPRCYHIPKVTYSLPGEDGKKSDKRAMAEGLIEDARLGELSGCHQGANDNAEFLGMKKARQLADAGLLLPDARAAVEALYGLTVPGHARLWAPGYDATQPQKEDQMPVEAERAAEAANTNTAPSAAEVSRIRNLEADEWRNSLVATLRTAGIEIPEGADVIGLVRSAAQESIALRGPAEDGRKWKAELVRVALDEGVRAFGDDFSLERQRPRLEGMAPEDIQLETRSWAAIGDKANPAGQQSATEVKDQDPKNPPAKRKIPTEAYRTPGRLSA